MVKYKQFDIAVWKSPSLGGHFNYAFAYCLGSIFYQKLAIKLIRADTRAEIPLIKQVIVTLQGY